MKNFDFPYINDLFVDLSGIEGAPREDKHRRYLADWVACAHLDHDDLDCPLVIAILEKESKDDE